MDEFLIDLSVGETIQIGEYVVTVIDAEDGEISVEIESDEGESEIHTLKTCREVLVEAF